MNALIITGSPKGFRSNSGTIAAKFAELLKQDGSMVDELDLHKDFPLESALQKLNCCDVLILITPVYENSVPGLIVGFFENILGHIKLISIKNRQMFVISNSGYPEVEANMDTLSVCKLFAEKAGFIWLGGAAIAPGTLIDSKDLDNSGGSFKRLIKYLSAVSKLIIQDKEIPEDVSKLVDRSFMSPALYRFGGRIIQKSNIKKIGKDKYYLRPLI